MMVLLSCMPASGEVKDFVQQAKVLLNVLRREGHELSAADLHMLTAHLHLLEMESTNLQTFKKRHSTDRAA